MVLNKTEVLKLSQILLGLIVMLLLVLLSIEVSPSFIILIPISFMITLITLIGTESVIKAKD